MGVRRLHLPLTLNQPVSTDAVGVTARLRFTTQLGEVHGLIVGIPDLPEQLVANQGRALAMQRRGADCAIALGVRAIGLGSALAVVAGRGRALGAELTTPVTTGHAATAWATACIADEVLANQREPVGVLGFKGPVGDAVTRQLVETGHEVWVHASGAAAARRATQVGAMQAESVGEVAQRCRVLVGCNTTGPVLEPTAVRDNTVLIDNALPRTLAPGPSPPGLVIVPGETLAPPHRVRAGFWGQVWLGLAGYGRGVIYACLAEPLAMSVLGEGSYSGGRRLDLERVRAAGDALIRLGFTPVARPRRR
jgi:predicted amino acid dehydrogenase